MVPLIAQSCNIISPKTKSGGKINKIFHDQEGCMLLLDRTVKQNNFVFINIYAPTKDKKWQKTFFGKIK